MATGSSFAGGWNGIYPDYTPYYAPDGSKGMNDWANRMFASTGIAPAASATGAQYGAAGYDPFAQTTTQATQPGAMPSSGAPGTIAPAMPGWGTSPAPTGQPMFGNTGTGSMSAGSLPTSMPGWGGGPGGAHPGDPGYDPNGGAPSWSGGGRGNNLGPNDMPLGQSAPNPNPLKNDPNFTPFGAPSDFTIGGYGGTPAAPGMMSASGSFSSPVGTIGNDRLQTTAGGSYIGAMTPGMGALTPQQSGNLWGFAPGSQDTSGIQANLLQPRASTGTSTGLPPGQTITAPASRASNFPDVTPFGTSAFNIGGYGGYDPSSYLKDMEKSITSQANENFSTNLLPAIRSNAVGNGSVGGSREGVAQGVAMGQTQKSIADAVARMYMDDSNAQQNRGLQRYGMDQGYFLGNQGQQLGFYNTQRQLDQSGAALGASLYGLGTNGMWNPLNNFTGMISPWAGNGNGTTTSNTSQGGGWPGILGGLGAGYQWWNALQKAQT